MLDVDAKIRCTRGEAEAFEHLLQCKKIKQTMKDQIKTEWQDETLNIKKIEATTEWMEDYLKQT